MSQVTVANCKASEIPYFTVKVTRHGWMKNAPQLSCSRDLYQLSHLIFDMDLIEFREEFIIVLLNRANKMIGYHQVGSGGTSDVLVDAKMVFSIALQKNASAIILMHNHPSGNTKPSRADITLTEKLKKGGELLDLLVLDHVITTADNGYYSFADEGRM